MQTVKEQIINSFREKGSKFIGYLFPATTVEQFNKKLEEIKSNHPGATHHCYSWRINPAKVKEFVQDDGEPSGTAGLPILNQLKSYKAVNCGCIVVRYYGGTKLGKSGLIKAYGQAAERCLKRSSFATLISTQNFQIEYPYAQQAKIDQLKNRFDLKEIASEYMENVTLEIACRSKHAEEFSSALQQLRHYNIRTEPKGASFVTLDS